LVLAAMRARGAQALTVLMLSVLAVAGAVGAPWYILAAERSALLADIATAPADQRVVTASRVLRLSDTDPAAGLGAFRATVERSLSIPGVRPVLGLSGLADAVGPDGGGVRVPVTYREDVCAHLTLVGRCPTGKDEALLSRYTAELMAAGIGARIPVRPPALGRATLTVQVVGLYVPTDRDEPYWSGAPATGVNGAANRLADPVFTVLDTFVAQPALVEPSATYSVALTGEALRGTDLGAILDRADYELRPTGIGLTSGGKALVGAEGRDGQDFAVVAGDGTIQLPPELLGRYPPGTLFTVDHEDGTVSLIPGGAAGVVVPPRGSGTVPD